MSNKNQRRSLIPKNAAALPKKKHYLNTDPAFLEGWQREGNSAVVLVSIKLLQSDYQCFSDWSKQEMRVFWAFNDKIHQHTWQQVLETASKQLGRKTGLGYTPLPAKLYPNSPFKASLDPQTVFFEVRVNEGMRVHGFRERSLFYICWLDRNHEICP